MSATEFQAKLIKGGVTDAEYRIAVEAYYSCVKERGWKVGEIRPDPQDDLKLSASFQKDPNGATANLTDKEERSEAWKTMTECREQYLRAVEYQYLLEHTLTGAEQQAEMAQLIECLRGLGIMDVLASDDGEKVNAKINAHFGKEPTRLPAFQCVSAHPRLFPPDDKWGPQE